MKFKKNSMFYWYPLIDGQVNTPKTILVPWEGKFTFNVIDGEPNEGFDRMIEHALLAADEIGYPLFLRSDETSNKHDWAKSCYVEKPEQMRQHICNILEYTGMVMFGPDFKGVAIREFLDLDAKFTSFWGRMPVAREIRAFVREGKLECWHPYWPPTSIERPSIENWKEVLDYLQTFTPSEIAHVTHIVEKVGSLVPGYWSVDVCITKDGIWYVTDMALGEDSYHWGTCQHASEEMLMNYGPPTFEGEKDE